MHTSTENEPGRRAARQPLAEQRELAGRPDVEKTHRLARSSGLAKGLGWFSVGLGLAELVAPRTVRRFVGGHEAEGNDWLVRALGARELISGLGILSGRGVDGWLGGRIAGNLVDLAVLGLAARSSSTSTQRLATAATVIAGITGLDVVALRRERAVAPEKDSRFHVSRSITIRRSPTEVYLFWRDLSNLPQLMGHLESVEMIDDRRSRWKLKGPLGKMISSVEAEFVDDHPGERLSWRFLHDSLERRGTARFRPAPGGRGCELSIELSLEAPGGELGAAIASLLGIAPELLLAQALGKAKQILELGEITKSDASIHVGPHPAVPQGGPR